MNGGSQHSFRTVGAALATETPPNSGKSAIFTSNRTEFVCAGFGFPAEVGADLVPLKPGNEL